MLIDDECPECGSDNTHEEFTDVTAGVHQMHCDDCELDYSIPIE